MVPGSYRHPLVIEDRSDVVGVNLTEQKRDHAGLALRGADQLRADARCLESLHEAHRGRALADRAIGAEHGNARRVRVQCAAVVMQPGKRRIAIFQATRKRCLG